MGKNKNKKECINSEECEMLLSFIELQSGTIRRILDIIKDLKKRVKALEEKNPHEEKEILPQKWF